MSTSIEKLIDAYEAGGPELRELVSRIPRAAADTRMEPGTWSCRELVVHLTDSDAIGIDRMKRTISEDCPTVMHAHEQAYIDRLHPKTQSLEDAVLLFEVSRRQFARVLRALGEGDWRLTCRHSVSGELTLAQLLELYTEHASHHMRLLSEKLDNLGVDTISPAG